MTFLKYDIDACIKWVQGNYQENYKYIILCLYKLVEKSDKVRLNEFLDSLVKNEIRLDWENKASFAYIAQ